MTLLSNIIRITPVTPADLADYCNEARVLEINFASKQILVDYYNDHVLNPPRQRCERVCLR